MPKPIRLTPSLREKLWGRTRLSPWFPDCEKPVGEAWFLADRELPLLVKLIFTTERLSVQVHPDDNDGAGPGKTEMWYILEADANASIALGFRETISRERLWEATQTGEVEHLLNWRPVKAGEAYFTPAHTVHALGAGLVLFEIQQNSDITYRLWDYGRPRETHVEQATPISDLGVHPGPAAPKKIAEGRAELVRSKHFITELVDLRAGERITPEPQNCQLWISVTGCGSIGGEPFRPGEVCLLPEAGIEILAETAARFLRTYVPAM